MPIQRYCFALVACAFVAPPLIAHAEPVRVMSFNIRYGTAPDGDNSWPHRAGLVTQVIGDFAPHVLGVQEALRGQMAALSHVFPLYDMVGLGRDADGSGEYSAVLFRADRFDLADAGTFWLSETPKAPGSRSWGNNLPRICTWVRLFDETNDQRFLVMNTHWDHESQPARLHGGELIAKRIAELAAPGEPVIVMGDFNATPDNPAMLALVAGGRLKDTFTTLHPDERDTGTFNGFGQQLGANKIDAILATDHWQVEAAAIDRTQFNGRYPSDHFPVTATVTLQKKLPAPLLDGKAGEGVEAK